MTLAHQFAAYTAWRTLLASDIAEFQTWLTDNELSDGQIDLRLGQLLERLAEDRLNVAFVAEFSRGKSELINAIFFADYGDRMLPSSIGRTTMCPTELLFDGNKPPQLELLPIQTRASNTGVGEYKRFPDQWERLPIDVDSPESLQDALRHVSETTRVTPDEASRLGFATDEEDNDLYRPDADGMVEIPRWRHALINFPHPLLKQGLVILDTPGLNAIGAEPELTLSLLPNAHAVLFILAADTGVTQSDHAIWKEHICTGGTFRLLEAVRAYYATLADEEREAFRFLHVSTDEVYGSLEKDAPAFSETHRYEPNSPYSASKAASDHLVRAYHHTYGLPVLTTNCSNNYGPYHFPEKLIPLVIHNALAGKPLPIYGDGQQIRDWLYVKDHCSAIRRVLAAGRLGEVYNVGGWNEKANLEVVHTLCDLLDELSPRADGQSYRCQITYVADRPGHDRRYAIDARKLEQELGWKPAETFTTGMRKTVCWYLDHPQWVANVTSGSYRDWVGQQYGADKA